MDEINRLLKKCNFQENHIVDIGLINEIEQWVNLALPGDYKFYLQNFSAFENFIGNEYVVLWDLSMLLKNNMAYSIIESLPSVIGIGSNGGGELLAIESLNSQSYRVVLIPFIGLDKDSAIEIGSSFTNFLLKLDTGHAWF